jgi:trimethylamine--corrinoid protein Co-methyltransferase
MANKSDEIINELSLVKISQNVLDRIHSTSLEILADVGVKFPDRDALNSLAEVGAEVDREHQIARIPESLVRESLARAPSNITLYSRDGRRDVRLGDGKPHFITSGVGVYIYDLETGVRRSATTQDTVDISRVVDYLPNIDILQVMVSPNDVPDRLADYYKFESALNNTTKHVSNCIGPVTADEGARDIVEMASIVCGGKEELMKRPIISVHQAPVSPLQYSSSGLRAMVEYAKNKIPICIYSMPMSGGTAPVTLVGTLVILNSEFLAGLTLLETISPAAPLIYGSVASIMDLRTGLLPIGAPERAILSVCAVNLGKKYGLPTLVAGGGTDAKMPGTRAGIEKTWTALPVVLAGADVIIGAGALDSASTYSYEQLIIDDEIAGGLSRIARGLELSEDTLASNLIKKVGIGGHFLAERHTLTHVKSEQWFPTLYSRIMRAEDSWDLKKLGETDLAAEARKKTKQILKTHVPRPLERDVQNKIRTLVDNATKQARR